MRYVLVLTSFLMIFNSAFAQNLTQNKRLYGYVYWQNGLPIQNLIRFPTHWANPAMAAEPDLIVQTGYYNMRFDLDDIDITGFDASQGSDYISALTEDVTQFSDGALLLKVYKNGVPYTARSGNVETEGLNVRLIESGQYVQRFDHTDIVFTDDNGNVLPERGYFEVTAWPDRVVFTLDFSDHSDITRTTIQVTTPSGIKHLQDQINNKISVAIKPQSHTKLSTLPVSSYISNARHKNTGHEVAVSFDSDTYAFRFDLPTTLVTYPSDMNTYDEYVFQVTNPTSSELNIPLVFNQNNVRQVTGTVMTLVEDDDGRPTGHAVQISKNWHNVADTPIKHEGTWLRGSTMITLPANGSKTLRLRSIYGYWGEVATASHAQLSLIGYTENGSNWQWDESALGSWGESMTFDPYQAIGGAFIDDVRPTFTTPMEGGGDHGWTPNYGGGNFMVYYDSHGDYRWAKSLKTAYRWTGPNMTEVLYSGVTDDDAIRFTYTTQLVSSNDYHRRFQHYNYDILKNISPSRLSYYSMTAEYYRSVEQDEFMMGSPTALIRDVDAEHGGNEYKSRYLFKNRWLTSDDTLANTGSLDALSNRGLIWRDSSVNDISSNVYLHTYGRSYGIDYTVFDVAGALPSQSYTQGTSIRGELEYIMPAETTKDYWGYDDYFFYRLGLTNNAWAMTQQEMNYNTFKPVVAVGTLEKGYPVTINAASGSNVLARFTIPGGYGVGHIPIIVKNAPAGLALRAQYQMEGSLSWEWAQENIGHIAGNEYYQGYLNADGTMDYVFSISRPYRTLSNHMEIRVFTNSNIAAP